MARTSEGDAGQAATANDGTGEQVPQTFTSMLTGCRFSAVHLEQRDVYTPDNADFLRWRNGDHFDPIEWGQGWIDMVAPLVERGVTVRRARIVSEPVSDYIRFEYGVTPMNVAAGEQVRWLPRRRASDLVVPGNDYWVFDDRLVQFNHFAGDGSSLRQPENRDESTVVSMCLSAFEAVWERAIPHEDYKPA
ncbi:DUF6879 family protein [Actinomadura sp. CNU-125]|uniref:DUF6879 family protein n=1 Tax=Actinomadura sp. CNU-125 TaxID=1904961 RepID=UPI0021CD0907|nr:DUF6879 family protein [Actinomadura sp. CNU-125]